MIRNVHVEVDTQSAPHAAAYSVAMNGRDMLHD